MSAARKRYDVSLDSQRFLMIKPVGQADENAPPPQLVVVQNWFEELKERVPVCRKGIRGTDSEFLPLEIIEANSAVRTRNFPADTLIGYKSRLWYHLPGFHGSVCNPLIQCNPASSSATTQSFPLARAG